MCAYLVLSLSTLPTLPTLPLEWCRRGEYTAYWGGRSAWQMSSRSTRSTRICDAQSTPDRQLATFRRAAAK